MNLGNNNLNVWYISHFLVLWFCYIRAIIARLESMTGLDSSHDFWWLESSHFDKRWWLDSSHVFYRITRL